MKNLEIKVKGKSDLVYCYFFDENFPDLLVEKAREFSGDFGSLLDESALHNKWVCKGFNYEEVECQATIDGASIYEGPLVSFSFDQSLDIDLIQKEFEEFFLSDARQFKNVITHNSEGAGERVSGASTLLSEANRFIYCVMETVGCCEASGSVQILVHDEFQLCDIRPVVVDFDSGDWEGLMRKIYGATDIEGEIIGFQYKGTVHEIDNIENTGGFNSFDYFRNNHGEWNPDWSVVEQVSDLGF